MDIKICDEPDNLNSLNYVCLHNYDLKNLEYLFEAFKNTQKAIVIYFNKDD